MSEDRIRKGIEDDESVALSGDSGGKAELLRLLEATKQPVILACNDIMGLWGVLHQRGAIRRIVLAAI